MITPQIQIAQPGVSKTRKQRRPNFPIQGGIAPMGLYPNFATMVMPGETLDEHTLKATMVSPPLANPLGGAWSETWLFYVKLTDLDRQLGEMFVGTLTDPSAYVASSTATHYFSKIGRLDWIKMCTERVHEVFFRDHDQPVIAHPDGVPMIKRINSDVFESMIVAQDGETDGGLIGDTETVELTPQVEAYLKMRKMGMGVTSYEDYLRTYGVATPPPAAEGEPELLAYRRYWTAPSNVIEPSTGAATGAWYWRFDEKNAKNKRFNEPGFLIGFWAVRPKLYDARLSGSLLGEAWGFERWLPSYVIDDPAAGIWQIDAADLDLYSAQDLSAQTGSFHFDWRDLVTHGEQFVNGLGRYSPFSTTYRSFLDADAADQGKLRGEYVNASDLQALMADFATTGYHLDYEGIVSVTLKGHVRDTT